MKIFRGAALAAMALGWAAAAQATSYVVTDLGSLDGPSGTSNAYGINNSGQITGWSSSGTTQRSFIWSAGTMIDAGGAWTAGSQAFGINASGQIAGVGVNSNDNVRHATLTVNGQAQDIGGGVAYAVNNAGQATGTSNYGYAFVYSNGQMTTLNGFGYKPGGFGDAQSVAGNAINNLGQVAGEARNTQGSHAVLWNGSTPTDLGTLSGGNYSSARGINDAGQVVGFSSIANGNTHAFLYSGGHMTDLMATADNGWADAINAAGLVVGFKNGDAFLYANGVITDLNNLIRADTGWHLTEARGINDQGQIVGYGTNAAGDSHAFLLTAAAVPEPSIWASMIVGFGAIGGVLRRQRRTQARFA